MVKFTAQNLTSNDIACGNAWLGKTLFVSWVITIRDSRRTPKNNLGEFSESLHLFTSVRLDQIGDLE